MTGYAVSVSEEVAESLSEYDDERIQDELRATLRELASVSEKQDNLHDRMNLEVSDDEAELSDEELKEELRAFMRNERKDDPRL